MARRVFHFSVLFAGLRGFSHGLMPRDSAAVMHDGTLLTAVGSSALQTGVPGSSLSPSKAAPLMRKQASTHKQEPKSDDAPFVLNSLLERGKQLMPGFKEQAILAGFNATSFINNNMMPNMNDDVSQYLELLMENRHRFPLTAANVTTRPADQALQIPPECPAEGYFRGPRRSPAHVVFIVHLSYELDILEALLYDLEDVVDTFVVYEGIYTDRGARKPLVFDRAHERFARFLPKIRHYVQVPEEVHFKVVKAAPQNDAWNNENTWKTAEERYVHDETAAGRPLNNTLFVNADIDEFPPAEGLLRFKYCHTDRLPSAFCTVMYDPDFETIHEYSHPCGKLGKHYWANPVIHRVGETMRYLPIATGKYHYDESVGSHVHARDPWGYVARVLSSAESKNGFKQLGVLTKLERESGIQRLGTPVTPDDLLNPGSLYLRLACHQRFKVPEHPHGALVLTDGKTKNWHIWNTSSYPYLRRIPWFMDHNRARFPYAFPTEFDYIHCK
mmetsp:Transcript_31996/g.56575  ORF Transcript_31996/g.56575 Transcript_31996/m.56575 type:complete len:501 (-) Transcript_31996:102-1604(-)